MTSALTASVVLLWLVVIALATVVVALARQIGVLHERVTPAGALQIAGGAEPGTRAPELSLKDLQGRDIHIGGGRDNGRHTLLFFLAPSCPVCKSLLPMLFSARKSEAGWLDVVLASDGEMQEQLKFVEREGLGVFPYVVSRELGVRYRVGKLPYACLIDDGGVIRSGGLVNSREHLESIFNAKDLSVASVQDYLRRKEGEAEHVA